MAHILLGGRETGVSEEVDEVLRLIVSSRDGIRNTAGNILAPPGWVLLTSADTGDRLYVQADRIEYVREDA